MVGVLWGGNIGAVVYPITEICLKKGTFATWIDQKIEENRDKIEKAEQEIQTLESGQTESPRALAIKQKELESLNRTESWLLWAKPIAKEYTPRSPFRTVVFLMAIIMIGTVLKIVFLVNHGILAAWIAQKSAMEIRDEYFRKVLDYEVNYFNREGIADTMSRFTNDMEALTRGLTAVYGKVVREPLKMVVCLIGAAYISWQLLLLTLLLAPTAAVAIRWLARSIKRVVRRSMEEMSNMYGRLEETFRSIRVVKAFTRENYERAKFRRTNRNYCARAIKIAKYESLANPLTEIFGIMMICISIIAGSYLVLGERTTFLGIPMLSEPLSMGALILFFALLVGASEPARKLSDIFTMFQGAAAAADRVYARIDREIAIREPGHPAVMPQHRESLCFEHIAFEYEPNRPVLKDVSLEIAFGECIAILGPSGCGKSTLLNLIPRFIDPTGGVIRVDGRSIAEVRFRDLRRQIGLVTQEPILFDDTVLNNIRYGRPTATRAEAIEAAKHAFAHEFIENELHEAYDTVVGPGGGLLSGGQRQRIALARAILRDPNIFLLDEATSQIDVHSERMIHQALKEFKTGRTTIMVTHRLSALSLADRIVLMEDGAVSAVGTHEELLQTSAFYARMF